MATDESFTRMIFFIASIVVAVSIAGMIMGISGLMVEELRTKATDTASELGSEIVIANDPRHVPYEDGVLKLYIKNVGDNAQYYNNLIIFIDGEFITHGARLVNTNQTAWTTGSVIEITALVDLEPGDHTAKAILQNGVSDTFEFRL
jgi:flagellar protein FlaG